MENELKSCHEGCSRIEATLHTEGKDAAEAMLEVLAAEFVVLVALETRIVHALYCRMLLKEFSHSKGIVAAALCAERQGLESLEHEEGVER